MPRSATKSPVEVTLNDLASTETCLTKDPALVSGEVLTSLGIFLSFEP